MFLSDIEVLYTSGARLAV